MCVLAHFLPEFIGFAFSAECCWLDLGYNYPVVISLLQDNGSVWHRTKLPGPHSPPLLLYSIQCYKE